MNEICIQNKKNITTKKSHSNINNSVSSEKTNETYKNKINKVSFKKKLVEVIKVECWKSFNIDTAKDIYEQIVLMYINLEKIKKYVACVIYFNQIE